jgi:peptide deformylase
MITTDTSILKAKNKSVEKNEINDLLNCLEVELKNSPRPGVGLAAPQIGINKRAAIIRLNQNNIQTNLDLINPIVIEKDGLFINKNEGCLSIPNKKINTYRFKEIFIKDDLHPAGIILTDFEAIVCLHEIDHLNSILITDIDTSKKVGRNDPCPCGQILNGKIIKYKHCHGQ